ncbi:hypothetical protein R3P38DRAFT_514640 [Favolaschia claudopus]|uniref:Uncharacterized protein n=1 Tax=Favolaschia claudopus TaxID=2862362 RepID=A0AAV9ZDB7_9AGAR
MSTVRLNHFFVFDFATSADRFVPLLSPQASRRRGLEFPLGCSAKKSAYQEEHLVLGARLVAAVPTSTAFTADPRLLAMRSTACVLERLMRWEYVAPSSSNKVATPKSFIQSALGAPPRSYQHSSALLSFTPPLAALAPQPNLTTPTPALQPSSRSSAQLHACIAFITASTVVGSCSYAAGAFKPPIWAMLRAVSTCGRSLLDSRS